MREIGQGPEASSAWKSHGGHGRAGASERTNASVPLWPFRNIRSRRSSLQKREGKRRDRGKSSSKSFCLPLRAKRRENLVSSRNRGSLAISASPKSRSQMRFADRRFALRRSGLQTAFVMSTPNSTAATRTSRPRCPPRSLGEHEKLAGRVTIHNVCRCSHVAFLQMTVTDLQVAAIRRILKPFIAAHAFASRTKSHSQADFKSRRHD